MIDQLGDLSYTIIHDHLTQSFAADGFYAVVIEFYKVKFPYLQGLGLHVGPFFVATGQTPDPRSRNTVESS